MTARDPSKPPGRRNRADGGGRPEKWPIPTLAAALIEARGEIAAACRLITAQAIAKSDRDDLRRRNRAQKNKLDEPHKSSEGPEITKMRHEECRIMPRQLHQYLDRHPELRAAREEGKRSFNIECEDVLHAAVREKVTKRIAHPDGGDAYVMVNQPTSLAVRTAMFVLDRRHPDYRRSISVSQSTSPADPLDAGGLPEAEQRALAGEGDPEEGGEP